MLTQTHQNAPLEQTYLAEKQRLLIRAHTSAATLFLAGFQHWTGWAHQPAQTVYITPQDSGSMHTDSIPNFHFRTAESPCLTTNVSFTLLKAFLSSTAVKTKNL